MSTNTSGSWLGARPMSSFDERGLGLVERRPSCFDELFLLFDDRVFSGTASLLRYRTPASRCDYPNEVNLCGGREVLRDELVDGALGPHRRRAEQLPDRLLVQGGVLGASGRKPEDLAVAECESVRIRRQRQHVLSHPRRGFRGEQHHLELPLRSLDQRTRERLVLGERPDLARRAQEDAHVVAERLRESLLDPVGHLGDRFAVGLEDDVAAGAEGVHVAEAELLELRAKLGTGYPPVAPQVDRTE